MDQQLLWIVALIGAGTLAGTFVKMKGGFGPINLRAVGIVLIAVLASLLAIAKLDNITAAMGILGAIAGYLFGAEAKESAGPGSTTGVNAVGSQVGDNARIAGRDINETVNNIERMLGDIRGLINATVQNMQLLSEKVAKTPLMQGNGNPRVNDLSMSILQPLFHSDRGIEYAAHQFRDQIVRLGMLQSMSRPGKLNDNAHMESFFHSMKTEELYGKTFTDDQQLRQTLSSYIAFYNQQRLHSSLRYLPPAAFERQQAKQACVN